jgi:hypothetical protein
MWWVDSPAQDGGLTEVGHALQAELDIDEGDVDRSDVIRLVLQLGFKEAAPNSFEAVLEAAREQATKRL